MDVWSCVLIAASISLCAMAWEQLGYIRKGGQLPGPRRALVTPFLGNVAAMVADPTRFWDGLAARARSGRHGLSWDVIFGRFIVFVRDSELSHKIFANVRPDAFHLVGHPFGKKLFGDKNLIFMFGEEHKDLRRRLAPLFTWKALAVYVSIQERTIRRHIKQWLRDHAASPSPVAMRGLCRDMNLETSQNVFVGPYLDPEARARFTRDYNLFNVGLMALPINLPGFAFHRATRAVERLVSTLAGCASRSKQRMRIPGQQPHCLIDFWMVETLAEIRAAEESGAPPPPHSSDMEVGQHIFDFLFAAQDASTSSLVWVCTLLHSNPHVLDKLLDEQGSLRGGGGGGGGGGGKIDLATPVDGEMLREMKYTEMVVKEVLRYRPPATMVPHIAAVDFPVTDSYTVPKGTIVFPSLLESSFQGFRDAYSFDPERFSADRHEDVEFKRNWLLFGAGSHQCLGQRYAINHLMLFTALFSSMVKWKRVATPGSDELLYVPTIVPKDGCLVHLQPRREEAEEEQERETEATTRIKSS